MDLHLKELEQNKHRLELIKMARELLNEEYINRRAQDHNRWLAESDLLWRTKRVKLPYPAFASYPTDEEIVAKASALYRFVNSTQPTEKAHDATDEIAHPDLTPVEMKTAASVKPESLVVPLESVWKTFLTPDAISETPSSDLAKEPDTSNISEPEESTPMPATLDNTESVPAVEAQPRIDHRVSGLQSLLPGWVRRTQTT